MSRSATFTPSSGLAAAMQLIEFGAPLEMLVVPSIGSSAMSNGGEPGSQVPSCSPLKMPGRVVLDPFADHDLAADVHEIEHPAHRVAGRRIRLFLFAAPEPVQGIQRRRLGRAHEVEFNDALDVVIVLRCASSSETFCIPGEIDKPTRAHSSCSCRSAFTTALRSVSEMLKSRCRRQPAV